MSIKSKWIVYDFLTITDVWFFILFFVQERASNTVVVEQAKTKIQPNVKQPAERLAQLVRFYLF